MKAIKTGGISRDTDSGFIDGYGGGISSGVEGIVAGTEVVGGFIQATGDI